MRSLCYYYYFCLSICICSCFDLMLMVQYVFSIYFPCYLFATRVLRGSVYIFGQSMNGNAYFANGLPMDYPWTTHGLPMGVVHGQSMGKICISTHGLPEYTAVLKLVGGRGGGGKAHGCIDLPGSVANNYKNKNRFKYKYLIFLIGSPHLASIHVMIVFTSYYLYDLCYYNYVVRYSYIAYYA